ncbi:MAG: peptidase M19 [Gammaproteobacteria bacterium]|nr:peptidase M19 [Gammaproteobacteria bacterium]
MSIKRILLKLSAGFIGLVILILCVLRFGVLPYIDRQRNAVLVSDTYAVSERTRAFHNAAFVADLHADSLLWGRDLRKRHSRGHADLPRLRDGGVDLQVFGVVTKVPGSYNYNSNSGDTDKLPLLFLAVWRSPKTWFNPKDRALAQAGEITWLAEKSPLSLVLRRDDLSAKGVKGLLALEGMHALGGKKEALIEFYSAGFRMMGLAHFFDNEIAGSAHGVDKYGLTELGRSLIPQMESLGITIDLAHASPAAIEDTLGLATKPAVVSHGGVKGTCPGLRNLSDTQLRNIAENGGVVGIGYWKEAVCEASLKAIVAAIVYTIKVAGVNHVGLGSDFDGTIVSPFDTTGLPMLTEALFAAGLSKEDVGKVLGGNVQRVLTANLPE